MPVYMYTSLDDPFALSGTQAMGINATGQIVGSYLNAGGNHGFLYSSGTIPSSTIRWPTKAPQRAASMPQA
jgi:probable HAF family extracellular repeat protein